MTVGCAPHIWPLRRSQCCPILRKECSWQREWEVLWSPLQVSLRLSPRLLWLHPRKFSSSTWISARCLPYRTFSGHLRFAVDLDVLFKVFANPSNSGLVDWIPTSGLLQTWTSQCFRSTTLAWPSDQHPGGFTLFSHRALCFPFSRNLSGFVFVIYMTILPTR